MCHARVGRDVAEAGNRTQRVNLRFVTRRGALRTLARQHGSPPAAHLLAERTAERARELRQNQSDAEAVLWHRLRRKGLAGYRFRRQQPIGPYIADFACMSRRLLIELDGDQHAETRAKDRRRDAYLRRQGFAVLRFWNSDVYENSDGVLDTIYSALSARHGRSPQDRRKGGVRLDDGTGEVRRRRQPRRKRRVPPSEEA